MLFQNLSFPKNFNGPITRKSIVHDPERLPGILASTRVLSYLQSLTISMRSCRNITNIGDAELLFSVLDRLPYLRELVEVSLSPRMLDLLCARAAEHLLHVTICHCKCPSEYDVPVPTLAMTRLTYLLRTRTRAGSSTDWSRLPCTPSARST